MIRQERYIYVSVAGSVCQQHTHASGLRLYGMRILKRKKPYRNEEKHEDN